MTMCKRGFAKERYEDRTYSMIRVYDLWFVCGEEEGCFMSARVGAGSEEEYRMREHEEAR